MAEGWSSEQIAELRRVEDGIRKRRQKEWEEERARWRAEWEDLGPEGQKAFNEMWMSGMPKDYVLQEAKRIGQARERQNAERMVRLMDKKWWQFWIK